MSDVDSTSTSSQPKIVDKVFTLPIVSDTCAYGLATATSLTSPLQPYLSSSLASLSPMVQTRLSHLLSLGQERLPEVVTSRLLLARNQVTAGVQYLDSTLCSGLDRLVVKVPSLTSPTPALYSSTRVAAVSQLTQATTYLASFTIAQLALKVSDAGLETASNLLKQLVPASYTYQCEPLLAGIKKVRGQVEDVRREGARASGSMKVSNMESSISFSAVCEVFGLNYILSILGISRVFAEAEDVSGKSEAPVEVVKQEVVAEKAVEQEVLVDLKEAKKSKKN